MEDIVLEKRNQFHANAPLLKGSAILSGVAIFCWTLRRDSKEAGRCTAQHSLICLGSHEPYHAKTEIEKPYKSFGRVAPLCYLNDLILLLDV